LVFQFLVALAVLTLVVYAFDWYRYKIDFTISIFSIILSGFFVELYYGLVTKFIYRSRIKKVEKQENYEAD
jgi:NhaP-type Na+/H+ or K+/H+ antiporter